MWLLAIRQLVYERSRSGLSILAIAAAVAVILVLSGFEQGLYIQSHNIVMQRKADLFVTQAGIENFHVVHSSLPQLLRAKIETVEGVKAAHPITGIWIIYDSNQDKMPVFVLVYDEWGGPTRIIQGKSPGESRDIVLDSGVAKKFGLKPGDSFVITDYEFKISGITQGQSALFSPMGFITYDGLLDLIFNSDIVSDISAFPLVSFLLIETHPGADLGKIKTRIEQTYPEVDVFTPEQIATKDVQVGRDMFGPIMKVLISVAYVIGLLIIMIIVYAEVATHRRQFGILKALGFSLGQLITAVANQLIICLSLALPGGLLLAYIIAHFIEWFAPVYLVPVTQIENLIYTLVGTVIMAFLGGLYPLRSIAHTDPVEAFKVD